MKRRQKEQQIPEPGDVCVLSWAVSPQYSEPQDHYVTLPLTGLQPCLIETRHGKTTKTVGAPVAVLPTDPPTSAPRQCPTYAKLLSLMWHEFDRKIKKGQATDMVQEWSEASHTDPPFRSDQLNKLIEGVKTFLNAAKNGIPETITAAVTELERTKNLAARWVPWRYLKCEETESRKENWRIIERWSTWEALGMTTRQRFDEHMKHFGKWHPTNKKDVSREMNTFGARCRYLRCECTKAKRKIGQA